MIRILHTSDWHLGRFLYGRSLLEDQAYSIDRLLELVDRVRPHALIIAGDVFDRSLPPEDAVTLLNHCLTELIQTRKLPVFLIPGNHDSAERLGFASQLLRDRNLTIFSRVEDAFKPMRLAGDDGREALIYGIPFVEPVLIARALGRDDIRSHDEAVSALCRAMLETHPKDLPSVLLCHAFVVGGESSESEKELSIGGSSQVEVRAFDGFSYTALGHLHKPQRAGREHVRYSGSLLPYSKSETGHTKSITEVHISPDGHCEILTHELPSLRKLRYIEGELARLLEEGTNDPGREDYLIAGLTDKGAVFDAFTRLRVIYPQLLHIARVGGYEPDALPALRNQKNKERSELDLFGEFFHEATGTELTGEERAALLLALGAQRADADGDPRSDSTEGAV